MKHEEELELRTVLRIAEALPAIVVSRQPWQYTDFAWPVERLWDPFFSFKGEDRTRRITRLERATVSRKSYSLDML